MKYRVYPHSIRLAVFGNGAISRPYIVRRCRVKMVVRWRKPGGRGVATVDVRRFKHDQIVIHFGGELTSVDAYTFANSLISFADTVRSVNAVVNPGQSIDVRLDAVGDGSFKAVIKQVRKGLGGFFSSAPSNVFWIIAALFIENSIDGESTIIIKEDVIIIERGGERIILSRDAYSQFENVRKDPEVRRNMSRTFKAMERDEAVENFGLAPEIEDEEPLVQIPRDDFARFSNLSDAIETGANRRLKSSRAVIVVLKPWINASKKKWAFEWNGVPVSAYVSDDNFLLRVKNHEIRFGNGDVLEVEIEYYQNFDATRDIWITDTSSYTVKIVYAFDPVNAERVILR